MSGSTPACSIAHQRPVRPMPDWISSAISRMPCSSHSSRRPCRNRRRGREVPALALDRLDDDGRDVSGAIWRPKTAAAGSGAPRSRRRRSSRQRSTRGNGAWWTIGTSGPKPARCLTFEFVSDSEPIVRPWNPPSKAMIPRPVGVVAGELDRALDGLGSRVAEEEHAGLLGERRDPGQALHELEVARLVEVGRGDVDELRPPAPGSPRVTFGCAWPVEQTAMPAAKSRKRLPSTSATDLGAGLGDERVGAGRDGLATASSRAMIARAFGPGSSVTMCGATGLRGSRS